MKRIKKYTNIRITNCPGETEGRKKIWQIKQSTMAQAGEGEDRVEVGRLDRKPDHSRKPGADLQSNRSHRGVKHGNSMIWCAFLKALCDNNLNGDLGRSGDTH